MKGGLNNLIFHLIILRTSGLKATIARKPREEPPERRLLKTTLACKRQDTIVDLLLKSSYKQVAGFK